MIFHDTARVAMQVPFDPPQYDGLGGEIFDHIEETVPAEVFPSTPTRSWGPPTSSYLVTG